MKRIALILASAAAFDLGIMAVSAQAQSQAPAPRSGPVDTRPVIVSGISTSGQGESAERQTLSETPDHKHERAIYIKIDLVNTVQACTSRQGEVVVHEGARQCRISDPAIDEAGEARATISQSGATIAMERATNAGDERDAQLGTGRLRSDGSLDSGRVGRSSTVNQGRIGSDQTGEQPSGIDIFLKIDAVNTVRACAARRGEVVVVDGVQQCRIPAPEAPATGNPARNPAGGNPHRN